MEMEPKLQLRLTLSLIYRKTKVKDQNQRWESNGFHQFSQVETF
jgi:hypothetical protein